MFGQKCLNAPIFKSYFPEMVQKSIIPGTRSIHRTPETFSASAYTFLRPQQIQFNIYNAIKEGTKTCLSMDSIASILIPLTLSTLNYGENPT